MAQLTYEVVDGKAVWGGRPLAEWVPDVAERIVEGFKPVKIVLFGSVARGEDTPDSDLDVLVILDRIEGRKHDQSVAVQRALNDVGAPVDVMLVDKAGLIERGARPGVLRAALREGEVIYDRAA